MYRFTLERYDGRKRNRYNCPSCGKKKEFTRYVDTETGNYLADDVGKCNRVAKCGYHYPPSEYFRDDPDRTKDFRAEFHSAGKSYAPRRVAHASLVFDTIDRDVLKRTLIEQRSNALLEYLQRIFTQAEVHEARDRYRIGTWRDGRTVFWQVDAFNRIRTGKLMSYDSRTGKRIKNRPPSWVHAESKRQEHSGSRSFNLRQCMFGEHLLRDSELPVGIAESEKTAVIMSVMYPGLVWLAAGGCGNLKLNSIFSHVRDGRVIKLFPDSTQFQKWSSLAESARRELGLNVQVSDLLEKKLTAEQQSEDMDLADIVIPLLTSFQRE